MVSAKTVETHLTHAYAKLDLSGPGARGRLAEALGEKEAAGEVPGEAQGSLGKDAERDGANATGLGRRLVLVARGGFRRRVRHVGQHRRLVGEGGVLGTVARLLELGAPRRRRRRRRPPPRACAPAW